MFKKKFTTHNAARLSQLAATAFICLGIGTNTHVGAANTLTDLHAAPVTRAAAPSPLPAAIAKNVEVLSPKDASLYRAIFKAQSNGDWAAADVAIANLKDDRLMGHVLADRYQRRPANAAELKDWLAKHNELPEADALYDRALAVTQGKVAKPALSNEWSSVESYSNTQGFRSDVSDNKRSILTRRLSVKITRSLKKNDAATAQKTLEAEQAKRVIPADELSELQARIAASYFYAANITAARNIAEDAADNKNPLALWINGLSAWKQDEISSAYRSFAKLASLPNLSSWDRSAAQFWAYRSAMRLNDSGMAKIYLEQAARQPHSFYGFMAAHLVRRNANWSWDLPTLGPKHVTILKAEPAGWRALALLQIGQPALAEAELRHLNPHGQRSLHEAMLAVASAGRMPSLAMQLGGVATNNSGKYYDAALYPVPSWQPEQGFQVDRALIYALIRHESQFEPTAVSNRGACGVMQLMPTTASLMANDNITECSGRMLDPAYNISLGQKYVRHLASQSMIGDNLVFMLAAYNGGPGNLSRWMDPETRNDPMLFIETLPIKETREYVQNVLLHYWTYRERFDEPQTSVTQMAQNEWPRYALNDNFGKKRIREAKASKPISVATAR